MSRAISLSTIRVSFCVAMVAIPSMLAFRFSWASFDLDPLLELSDSVHIEVNILAVLSLDVAILVPVRLAVATDCLF